MMRPPLDEAMWLREVDRGNAPGLPLRVVAALELDGLVRGEGILTVLTDEGERRLAAVKVRFIKRAAAMGLIRDHWLTTFASEQLLAMHEPRWDRLRNYELETMLRETFADEWCIAEWCPFNGRFCQLSKHVPEPHPPMSDETAHPPRTNVPWNEYTGPLYEPPGC